jgi:hypothetical protein
MGNVRNFNSETCNETISPESLLKENRLKENRKRRHEIEQTLGRKMTVEETAKLYGIPLPSEQSQRDVFDFEAGKRVNPDL